MDATAGSLTSQSLSSRRSISAASSIIGFLSSREQSAQKLTAKLTVREHSVHSPKLSNSMTTKTISIFNVNMTTDLSSHCRRPLETDQVAVPLTSSSLVSCRSISAPSSIIECLTSRRESAQKRSAKLEMDFSTKFMSPQRERTVISSIRSRKRSHLRSVSEPNLSDHQYQHSAQSSLDTETKVIAPKRRKLSCSSHVRIIGRRSTSQSMASLNSGMRDSPFPSLSLQDLPLLTLSYKGTTMKASSDDLSETEDIDIAPRSGKQCMAKRKERSLNGLDPFKLGGVSDLDIDPFTDRMNSFEL